MELTFILETMIYYFIFCGLYFSFKSLIRSWNEKFSVYAVWYDSPLHHTGIMTESTDGIRNYYDFDDHNGTTMGVRESKGENSAYKNIHSKIEIYSNIPIFKRERMERDVICKDIGKYDMGLNSCRVHVALVADRLLDASEVEKRKQVAKFLQDASENTFEGLVNSTPGRWMSIMLRATSGARAIDSLVDLLKKKHLYSFNSILIDGYSESDAEASIVGSNPEKP